MDITGYILRIATKQWVDNVFTMAIYYTNIHRKWKQGQTVLFIHKTGGGDALVGYGVIEAVHEIAELAAEEKGECEKHGWRRALLFTYVVRFEKSLPVKETFLRDRKFRGRCCHGLPLNKEQLDSIISQAEHQQP